MSNELVDVRYDETDQQPYLSQIKAILSRALGDLLAGTDSAYEVYLFGSRAMGQFNDVSDFDIAVLASRDIGRELSIARELLEASNIPSTVDLVDLSATSAEFSHQVRQEGILLWES